VAEAAGWPAELSAADADQVQGSIRHCEGRLDRYRGALFTLVLTSIHKTHDAFVPFV